MRALEVIRDHVTFKLPYDFSYHMKTPTDVKNQVKIVLRFEFQVGYSIQAILQHRPTLI